MSPPSGMGVDPGVLVARCGHDIKDAIACRYVTSLAWPSGKIQRRALPHVTEHTPQPSVVCGSREYEGAAKSSRRQRPPRPDRRGRDSDRKRGHSSAGVAGFERSSQSRRDHWPLHGASALRSHSLVGEAGGPDRSARVPERRRCWGTREIGMVEDQPRPHAGAVAPGACRCTWTQPRALHRVPDASGATDRRYRAPCTPPRGSTVGVVLPRPAVPTVAACLTVTRAAWPTIKAACAALPDASVTSATTPWAPGVVFVNVGPAGTSKGSAIAWLTERVGLVVTR
jgi:hypothetical protein